MNPVLAFVFGFIFCRILHNLYIIGGVTIFMRNAAENALKLLGNAAEDIAFIRQLKYQTVEKYGDTEHLKVIRNTDDYVFNTWKRTAIENYKQNFPAPYNKNIAFDTWEEAMKALDEIYKSEMTSKHEN